jgi:serine/threonine protein kinase
MGGNSSKSDNGDEERRRESLIKRKADMVKHVAQDRKQDDDTLDKMAKFLLVLVQSTNNNTITNDRKQIEIDGVHYTINQFINKGGFGEVYKAQRRDNHQNVAIKIMTNTASIREEIENEIKFLNLTKSIKIRNHPVIDYYGCKITNEQIFISMELAVCDLLTFWFDQIQTKDQTEKFIFGLIIIIYVLRALIFLEKLNIIHGDIKPQNLVIVEGNQCFYIKLIDFGTVEKMSTQRHQLTVDANKAHTIFFASPEFLKRDSNHMIARHLNKKSDAWAAGVMFYILFFETLPWKDQFDYENFCNDPHAKDIVVPQQGGYQLIIELLLKKNPKERSSAKATFMQIKSHPTMGNIVQTIQNRFYPVDDVCHMNIPDHVRQQLGLAFNY